MLPPLDPTLTEFHGASFGAAACACACTCACAGSLAVAGAAAAAVEDAAVAGAAAAVDAAFLIASSCALGVIDARARPSLGPGTYSAAAACKKVNSSERGT